MDFRLTKIGALANVPARASVTGQQSSEQALPADLKCNACGRYVPDARPLPAFSCNREGKNIRAPWFWCGRCGSCFCAINPTERDEVMHHQTREHGRLARFQNYRALKRPLYQRICAGIVKRGLSGGDLLDVGASFGGFLDEIRPWGLNASAIDINPDCVEYLQTQGFTASQASSLAQFSSNGSTFDVITMLDVPYYFRDQAAEFKTAQELLRPGGWLVLRTTNKRWAVRLSTVIARISPSRAQKIFARSVVDHSFVQSVGSLKRVLQDTGYQEIFIEPDTTHIIQNVHWHARAAYVLGTVVSKLAGRTLLVPGVIVWARRP